MKTPGCLLLVVAATALLGGAILGVRWINEQTVPAEATEETSPALRETEAALDASKPHLPGDELTARQSAEATARLKDAIVRVRNASPLAFGTFTRCERVLGFGQFVPASDHVLKLGARPLFYYEPLNVHTTQRDDYYEVHYVQDVTIAKANGRIVQQERNTLNFRAGGPQPFIDQHVTTRVDCSTLPPGDYVITFTLRDLLGDKTASHDYAFTIERE